jgi:hypothetical protein
VIANSYPSAGLYSRALPVAGLYKRIQFRNFCGMAVQEYKVGRYLWKVSSRGDNREFPVAGGSEK